MVRLLLFRAVSLTALLALLIWELLDGGFNDPGFDRVQKFTIEDEFMKEQDSEVQGRRKRELIDYCHTRDAESMLPRGTKDLQVHPYMFRNIIVNDKHNLLYCYIPKVACSNWKRVLMVLNGDTTDPYTINTADVHNRSLGYFRYLNEYSPTEIVHRLKNYYKFLFVRHPYERLVSAYRNKFIDSYNYTLFKQLYGRRIIKHFRRNPDQRSLKTGEGVSFTEFVSYLLASDSEFSDRHWQQYDLLCRPCLIYYDYVGKFENLRSDADDLLRVLGVEDRVQFPHNMSSGYKTSSSHLAKQYFRQLPLELKDRLRKLYKHDLNMFGYSAEDFE